MYRLVKVHEGCSRRLNNALLFRMSKEMDRAAISLTEYSIGDKARGIQAVADSTQCYTDWSICMRDVLSKVRLHSAFY